MWKVCVIIVNESFLKIWNIGILPKYYCIRVVKLNFTAHSTKYNILWTQNKVLFVSFRRIQKIGIWNLCSRWKLSLEWMHENEKIIAFSKEDDINQSVNYELKWNWWNCMIKLISLNSMFTSLIKLKKYLHWSYLIMF